MIVNLTEKELLLVLSVLEDEKLSSYDFISSCVVDDNALKIERYFIRRVNSLIRKIRSVYVNCIDNN